MKKTLLAASVALAVFGSIGAGGYALADPYDHPTTNDSDQYHHDSDRDHHDSNRDGYHHDGDRSQTVRHFWWHHRWYDSQPARYHYVAPPHPYEDAYWHKHWRRYHHCRDWDQDGDCH